jgi:general secretion pathway protein D
MRRIAVNRRTILALAAVGATVTAPQAWSQTPAPPAPAAAPAAAPAIAPAPAAPVAVPATVPIPTTVTPPATQGGAVPTPANPPGAAPAAQGAQVGTGADAAPTDTGDQGDEGERPLAEDEAMVLNFERADVREVIHSLATALGLAYTIDPRIEGQVTIRTTGKIARKDLFPLFNSILRNNGIAAVKQGDFYQIVPVAEAKTRAIIPRGAIQQGVHAEDSFVIEIVSLNHVAADEMSNILQPFITPGGDVLAYLRANTLIITDLDSNVKRLRELVATFDIDGFHNLHAHVFKLKEGDPDDLANELLGLLAPYGVTPTGQGEAGLSLVPLSRLDSIVAFALDKSAFDEIARWLTILDVPPDQTSGRQTFVYNVENAKAADLAAVLNELFGGGQGAGGGPGGIGRNPRGQPSGVGLFGAGGVSGAGGGAGGAGGRGGGGFGGGGGGLGGGGSRFGGRGGATSSSLTGSSGQSGGIGGGGGGSFGGNRRSGLSGGASGAPGQPGQPGAPGQGGVLGVSLPGGAQAAAQGAAGPLGQMQGPPPIFKSEVRIVADDVTNSLVVLATKRDYQLILDVLRRIDVVPRQVVLEVMIAEVVLNKGLQFGIAYAAAEGSLGKLASTNQTTVTNTNTNANGGTTNNTTATTTGTVDILARSLSQLGGGLLGNATRFPTAGGFAVVSPNDNVMIFLNALQSLTDVKMLSAPHIIAADNREAHILVGQSIPILTQTQTSTGITGTVGAAISQVQYRDTGKILTVLPQVNSQGLVNLQIRQEVSAVLQTAQGAVTSFGNTNSPAFSTREAETTVVVQDGETVLIGGIIDDSVQHTRSGIPYLMDIPALGRLFRSDSDTLDRTELLITITPSVIRSRDEARTVTEDYADRIQGLKDLRRSMEARRHHRSTDVPRSEAPAPAEP